MPLQLQIAHCTKITYRNAIIHVIGVRWIVITKIFSGNFSFVPNASILKVIGAESKFFFNRITFSNILLCTWQEKSGLTA